MGRGPVFFGGGVEKEKPHPPRQMAAGAVLVYTRGASTRRMDRNSRRGQDRSRHCSRVIF